MPKQTHRNHDHVKRHNTPSLNNEVITSHLEELLTKRDFGATSVLSSIGITRSHPEFVISVCITLAQVANEPLAGLPQRNKELFKWLEHVEVGRSR